MSNLEEKAHKLWEWAKSSENIIFTALGSVGVISGVVFPYFSDPRNELITVILAFASGGLIGSSVRGILWDHETRKAVALKRYEDERDAKIKAEEEAEWQERLAQQEEEEEEEQEQDDIDWFKRLLYEEKDNIYTVYLNPDAEFSTESADAVCSEPYMRRCAFEEPVSPDTCLVHLDKEYRELFDRHPELFDYVRKNREADEHKTKDD